MPNKIILTRSVEDNQILAKQLLGLNYSVIEFPAIKIVDQFDLNRKLALTQYDCLVFTSTKAIQAAKRYFEQQKIVIPGAMIVAVVGKSCARIFQELFRRTPDLTAGKSDSLSLAKDLLLKLGVEQKVLFLAGDLSLDIVPRKLQEQGISVDTLVIYRNVVPSPDTEALSAIRREDPADLIFPFFSPSAVVNCIKLLGDSGALLQDAKIISIGNRTTAKLKDYQLVPVLQLAQPDNEDLLQAISQLVQE